MRPITKVFVGIAVAFLSACSAGPAPQLLQADPTAPRTLETARTIFADRTMITQGPHGTQIEYHRNDGKSFLWYPGNTVSVPANWKVDDYSGRTGHQICWQYPPHSKNGLTGISSKGRWQCTPIPHYSDGLTEVLKGDPFDLASGKVPYRLSRDRYSARQLIEPTERAPGSLRYVFPQ